MPKATKELQREYNRQWRAARRAKWMASVGAWCRMCGATERLEVDHIDPRTKVHHAVWTWSQKRRDAELAKCQLLCRACHQKKTMQDYPTQAPSPHGSVRRYKRHGCRCDLCVIENRRRAAEYRARVRRGEPTQNNVPARVQRVTFRGAVMTLRELAAAHRMDIETLRGRIQRGISPESAVSLPVKVRVS